MQQLLQRPETAFEAKQLFSRDEIFEHFMGAEDSSRIKSSPPKKFPFRSFQVCIPGYLIFFFVTKLAGF